MQTPQSLHSTPSAEPTPRTKHALKRLQQRAIPEFVVDLLEVFGSPMRCHGADRLIFDKAARKRLTRHLGGAKDLRSVERWFNVYAVVSDHGRLITVARKTGRFLRH